MEGGVLRVEHLLTTLASEGIRIGKTDCDQCADVSKISGFFPGETGALSFIKNPADPSLQMPSLSSLVFIPSNTSGTFAEGSLAYAETDSPRLAFAVASNILMREVDLYGLATQKIALSADLGARVELSGNIAIGANSCIGQGTVIGREGFGFERLGTTAIFRIPHIGSVIVGREVEIGANCTIDRGTFGPTKIGSYTKIDNQVHIAHNVQVGEACLIAAGASIAGSTVVDDGAWIGPHAVVGNGLRIGEGAEIGIGSVVLKNVPPGAKVLGNPARQHQ